jgi:hypothetical protein
MVERDKAPEPYVCPVCGRVVYFKPDWKFPGRWLAVDVQGEPHKNECFPR